MTAAKRRATFDRIDALSRIPSPSVHERRWLLEARRAIHSADMRDAIARGDMHAAYGSEACRANVDAQLMRLNREADQAITR